jgi:hypothetical protein
VLSQVPIERFLKFKNLLWHLLENNTETVLPSNEVEEFLNSIYAFNPKSPTHIVSKFCGGTVDIVIETKDRSGVNRILGFSFQNEPHPHSSTQVAITPTSFTR